MLAVEGPSSGTFSNIVDLIRALAALLWPSVGLVFLLVFRHEIREFFGRLRRGKILGQEVELEASLRALNDSVSAATVEARIQPQSAPQLQSERKVDAVPDPQNERDILELAAISPKAALMMLSALIEKEAREVHAISGHLRGRTNISLAQAMAELEERLPRHIPSSLKHFRDARNKIIHGIGATNDDALAAIDSGISILRALRAIPHETSVVCEVNVPLFSDPDGKQNVDGIWGLLLENTSPGGTRKRRQIFPTTKTHFRKGEQVSWEWSANWLLGPTWYQDFHTGEMKHAWDRACEFIGRPLDATHDT